MLKKVNKHMVSRATHWNCLYLTFVVLTSVPISDCAPCMEDFWWDPIQDSCIRCTICDDQSIVLRPCQPHKDTVCGTLNDLEFDYNWIDPIESDAKWKECTNDPQLAKQTDDTIWDWQAASLTLVAVACLLLFIVVAYISFRNAKQWKKMEKMERKFDRDVEELSSRLMSTIVDIRAIENGRIILEEQEKDKIFNPLEVRCVYLEQLIAAGANLMNGTERGNIYIEEINNAPK